MQQVIAIFAMMALGWTAPVVDAVHTLEVVKGGPVTLRSFDARVEVTGRSGRSPTVRVTQVYELDPGAAAFTAALASAQQGEDAPGDEPFSGRPYDRSTWAVRDLAVAVDGRAVPPVVVNGSSPNASGTIGALAFEVPAGAHRIELRYELPLDRNQGEDGIRFDADALSSWKHGPARHRVTIAGLGELPATHVSAAVIAGRAGRATPYARPAWRFASGTIDAVGEGAPPSLGLNVPSGECGPRPGDVDVLAGYCSVNGGCPACDPHYFAPYRLRRWAETAAAGVFSRRSLQLARNWIYARHGQRFETPWLRDYFAAQPWYSAGKEVPDAALPPDERSAVELLRELEAAAPEDPR